MDHEYEYCTHENTTHNEYMYFSMNNILSFVDDLVHTSQSSSHLKPDRTPVCGERSGSAGRVSAAADTARDGQKAPKMSRNGVNYGVSTLFMSLITQLSLDHESE